MLLATSIVLTAAAGTPTAGQEVKLPLESYEELRTRASPEPPPPPAALTLEEVRLEIQVGEDSARVVQELEIFVEAEGWQVLPLSAIGSFISADLRDLDGWLEGEDGNVLRLRGRGRHRLRLESALPVERDPSAARGTRRLTLPLPPAVVVHGLLRVPEEIEEVTTEGEGILSRETHGWRFVAEPGASLKLALLGATVAPERSGLPLRYEALSATAMTVTRTRSRIEAWIRARVHQGRLEKLTVPLPSGLEPVRVEGESLAGWDVQDGHLEVVPALPVEDELSIHLELSGLPGEELESPLLVPQGAERVRLYTRMHAAADALLSLLDAGSGRSVGLSGEADLPPSFAEAEGMLLAVSVPERPPRWRVEWAEGVEVLATQIHRLLLDVLVGEGGRAFSQMWLETESRAGRRLTVTPPPGFELVASSRNGSVVSPGLEGTALVLPLSASGSREVLFVSGFVPLELRAESGRFEIPLPELSAPVRRVEVRVLLPGRGRRYELADVTRAGWIGEPPGAAPTAASGRLGKQLAGTAGSVEAVGGADLLPVPPGFQEIEGSWSALSSSPSPLKIDLMARKPGKEWF